MGIARNSPKHYSVSTIMTHWPMLKTRLMNLCITSTILLFFDIQFKNTLNFIFPSFSFSQVSQPPHFYDIQQIITEVASSDSDILTFIVIQSSFSGITFFHPINFFPFREDNCQDDDSSWCTEIMNFPTDLRFQLKKYIIHFHCRLSIPHSCNSFIGSISILSPFQNGIFLHLSTRPLLSVVLTGCQVTVLRILNSNIFI